MRYGDCISRERETPKGLGRIRSPQARRCRIARDTQAWLDKGHTIEQLESRELPPRAFPWPSEIHDLLEILHHG